MWLITNRFLLYGDFCFTLCNKLLYQSRRSDLYCHRFLHFCPFNNIVVNIPPRFTLKLQNSMENSGSALVYHIVLQFQSKTLCHTYNTYCTMHEIKTLVFLPWYLDHSNTAIVTWHISYYNYTYIVVYNFLSEIALCGRILNNMACIFNGMINLCSVINACASYAIEYSVIDYIS